MIHIRRTTIALTVLILLAPGLNRVTRSQTSASSEISKRTFVISGSVGVAGVVMTGLPGEPISDSNGRYQATVEYGWSGTVTPKREGHEFEPKQRTYRTVGADHRDEDYTAKVFTFTISGSVGLAGVVMQGLPGGVVTDENGSYNAYVPYAWTGQVLPSKQGYAFEPPARQYTRVTEDRTDEDYVAQVRAITISGSVGAADVILKGFPEEVVSGQDGSYSVEVPYGWAGTIIPMKDGYSFSPARREIAIIRQNHPNADFTAKARMLTITDQIVLDGDEPVPGVQIKAVPGGNSAVTDAQGRYTIQVPFGWSGDLFLEKGGFEFDPPSVHYDNVTENIDLTASRHPAPPVGTTYPKGLAGDVAGDVLIVPTAGVSSVQFAQTAEDMRVMLDILREKLSEPRTISGVLYDYGDFFGDSKRATEALYLQGYGAIFMLKADFPLTPPASQDQAEPPKTEPADPVWQRARDRLYAPQNAGAYRPSGVSSEAQEKSFDQLKEDLVKTLKHAANIRNLDPNEWIILTVTGRSGGSFSGGFGGGMYGNMGMMGGYGGAGSGGGMYGGMMGGYGGGTVGGVTGGPRSSMSRTRGPGRTPRTQADSASATVLTIQARKADVDALAGGSLSFEQFQEKVKIFTY